MSCVRTHMPVLPSSSWDSCHKNALIQLLHLSGVSTKLQTKQAQEYIHHFVSTCSIQWKFSPGRSPNFGGLWEAGIKCMKVLLYNSSEELSTVITEVEATLNSRPLMPIHTSTPDGSDIITGTSSPITFCPCLLCQQDL